MRPDRASLGDPEAQEEAGLISRCVSWTPGAWEAFVGKHASFVQAEARRQLLRYLGKAAPADVEDAGQEVFSLLMRDGARTLRQFRRESSLSTWLAYIVRSVCRQIARHERVGAGSPREILYLPPSEEDLPFEGLSEALARLPARDQRLLRLFFFEQKKYREISSRLGVSINSVGPLMSRALTAVRRLLKS